MKIKSLMYVLMGTMLVTTSCSDNELEKGNDGSGTVDPVNASTLVNVYSDKSASEASLLVGDVLVKDSRTLTLNVPAACEKVYMTIQFREQKLQKNLLCLLLVVV